MRPRYSVVITAHNAAGTIGDSLRSLARQEGIAPRDLEVVLVDDRSTDDTLEAARAAGLDCLRPIRIDKAASSDLTTRQQALAVAFTEARGDIVLTLDADGIAAPRWVSRMVEPIQQGRADAVAGGVSFRARTGWIGLWQTVDQTVYLSICRILSALGFASGVLFGSFAFRRELFAGIDGWERIGRTLIEDMAFAHALHAGGARIAYDARPDMEVEACASWGVLIERAKRVSAGGVSTLSIAIGGWMALLIAAAIAAAIFGGAAMTVLAVRYGLGVAHAMFALLRAGQWRLAPLAFLYEPLAIGIGALVAVRLMRGNSVEWGGNRYER